MIGLAEAGAEWQDDAAFLVFRHSADAVAEQTRNDIGLSELGVAGVEHDGLAIGEGVVERLGEACVPALGQPAGLNRRIVAGGIVINRKVRRLENLKLEILVTHFIPPERLRVARRHRRKSHETDGHDAFDQHVPPVRVDLRQSTPRPELLRRHP